MTRTVNSRRGLRLWRIAVEMILFVMVTLLWVEYGSLFLRPLGWISRWQVFPVGVGVSVGVILFWLLVSLIFGRIYCSTVCPLGAWLDGVGRAGRMSRRGQARHYHYSPPLTHWRAVSLGVFFVSVVAGIAIIPAIIEPYSMYSRFVVNVLKPLWGEINNLLAQLGNATGWWDMYYVGHLRAGAFAVALSVVTMIGVSIPAWFFGRTYCNSICPVGTVLGIASARSVWHIDIDTDLCTNCRRCEWACKASCIDLTDHVVDGSRCVDCFDCIAACPDDAIFYRPTRKQLATPLMQRLFPPRVAAPSASASAPINELSEPSCRKMNESPAPADD